MAAALSITSYMHELKHAGFTDEQAEVQARQVELLSGALKHEAASKQDVEVAKKELELSIERVRKDLELSIEKVRKDLELSIEKVRKDLELSIEKVRTDLTLSMQQMRNELEASIEKTRSDLTLSIEKLRYESIKFIIWTGVGVVAAIGGMLAKGFHWV